MLTMTEGLGMLGLLLLGVAVYLWFGVPAVLAYVGAVLLVVAPALEYARMRREHEVQKERVKRRL